MIGVIEVNGPGFVATRVPFMQLRAQASLFFALLKVLDSHVGGRLRIPFSQPGVMPPTLFTPAGDGHNSTTASLCALDSAWTVS